MVSLLRTHSGLYMVLDEVLCSDKHTTSLLASHKKTLQHRHNTSAGLPDVGINLMWVSSSVTSQHGHLWSSFLSTQVSKQSAHTVAPHSSAVGFSSTCAHIGHARSGGADRYDGRELWGNNGSTAINLILLTTVVCGSAWCTQPCKVITDLVC